MLKKMSAELWQMFDEAFASAEKQLLIAHLARNND